MGRDNGLTAYRWPEAEQIRAERDIYEDIWSIESYGVHSPGEQHASVFFDVVCPAAGSTVLDAGCGSGKGALALQARGLSVTLVDMTDAGLTEAARGLPFRPHVLWHHYSETVDYVYCCDVMEHIPTEWTMLTLQRLLEASRIGLFLSIGLEPDRYGVLVGRSLHLTVQPFTWWRDHLRQLGHLVEARDLVHSGIYYVTPYA